MSDCKQGGKKNSFTKSKGVRRGRSTMYNEVSAIIGTRNLFRRSNRIYSVKWEIGICHKEKRRKERLRL